MNHKSILHVICLSAVLLRMHYIQAQTSDIMNFFKTEVTSTQVKGDFAEYIIEQQKTADGYTRIGHINEVNGIDAIFVKKGLSEGEIERCVLETKFNRSTLEPETNTNPKQMTKDWILQRLKTESESILEYKDRKFLQSLTPSATKPPATIQFTRLITKDFEEILIFNDVKTNKPVYYHYNGQLKIGDISQAVTHTANLIKGFKKNYKAILARVMANEEGDLISVEQQLTTKAEPNPTTTPVVRKVNPTLIDSALAFATHKRNKPELYLKFVEQFEPEKRDRLADAFHETDKSQYKNQNHTNQAIVLPEKNAFSIKTKKPWYRRMFKGLKKVKI